MKAFIDMDGVLCIRGENPTERFALKTWEEKSKMRTSTVEEVYSSESIKIRDGADEDLTLFLGGF